MINGWIKIELLAGTSIEDAAKDACELAERIQYNVDFTFNGVRCMASPGGRYTKLVESWHEALQSKSQYKFAKC